MLYRIHYPRKNDGRPGPIIGYVHLCDQLFYNPPQLLAKLGEARIIPETWYDLSKLSIRCCNGLLYGLNAYEILYDVRLLKKVLYIHPVPSLQPTPPDTSVFGKLTFTYPYGVSNTYTTATIGTTGGPGIYGGTVGQGGVLIWNGQNYTWGNNR